MTLENLLQEVLKDEVFFRASGGGVTLSGGEVLMQAGFAARFLQRLRQSGPGPLALTFAAKPALLRLP